LVSVTAMPRSLATILALTRFTSSVWYWSRPLRTEMVTAAVSSRPISPRYSTRSSLRGASRIWPKKAPSFSPRAR